MVYSTKWRWSKLNICFPFAAQVTITINGRPDVELYFNIPWTKDNPVYVIPILENYGIGREIMKLQARDPADINSIVAMYEEVPNSDPGNYFTVMNDNNQGGQFNG